MKPRALGGITRKTKENNRIYKKKRKAAWLSSFFTSSHGDGSGSGPLVFLIWPGIVNGVDKPGENNSHWNGQ